MPDLKETESCGVLGPWSYEPAALVTAGTRSMKAQSYSTELGKWAGGHNFGEELLVTDHCSMRES